MDQRVGAQQYTVSWWQNPSGTVQSTPVNSSTATFPVTGLSPDTSYSFQVTADDGVNTASQSNIQNVTTLPPAPTLTATPISSTQINLSWNSVHGATDYVIDDVVNGTPSQMANAGTSTSDSLKGLSPYTAYQLEVGTVGPWGMVWSSAKPVTTLPAPLVVTGTPVSSSQINLSWNGVPGANDYMVDELNGSTWTEFKDAGTSTSFAGTGLSGNTDYQFKVGDAGPWGVTWSNVVSAYVPRRPVANRYAQVGDADQHRMESGRRHVSVRD